MDTQLSDDQQALQQAFVQLLDRYRQPAESLAVPYRLNADLERDLVGSGYLELGRTEGYGVFEAALLTEAAAQIPFTIEVAASAIVAPQVSATPLPRPLALARTRGGALREPVRYLPVAQAVLVATETDVRLLPRAAFEVREVETHFAYPMGVFTSARLDQASVLPGVTPAQLIHWWQLGLAAEATGCMQSAIDLTVLYLKERRQFGRPIGSFQALQHRISECVTLLESQRVLTQKAAYSGDRGDAALAAYYAQEAAARVVLDCQQMHGAMGCTLEYPLHFWTYRLKVLQGELGGFLGQAQVAAEALWAA